MRQRSYLNRKLASPDTSKSNFKFADAVSLTALLLTLTTALLYYLGSTYYSGYLSYWGLPEELFSLSREKSVISGVIIYVVLCVRELSNYVVFLVVVIEGLIFVVLLCAFKSIKDFLVRQLRKFFRLNNSQGSRHEGMGGAAKRVIGRLIAAMLVVASPLILAFVIALLTQWASKQGREGAKEEHKKVLYGKEVVKSFGSTAILSVKNESRGFDQYSGHIILTSATHCAIYDHVNGVMIFPLSNVSRMVIHENKNIAFK